VGSLFIHPAQNQLRITDHTLGEIRQDTAKRWYLNGKANIKVGEKSVSVQIGMNRGIVGSKELPK
jgi:hypothetical protein